MSVILDYILQTNLFNFIIFAGIIIFLAIKFDVIGGIDKAKETVKDTVNASITAKGNSEEKLSGIEEKLSHISEEIEEIISSSVENAKLVGGQILNEAGKTVENIEENSRKLVENRTALLRNDILRKASLASVEIAKNRIINELNNNFDLHTKLINESVEAIDRMGGSHG